MSTPVQLSSRTAKKLAGVLDKSQGGRSFLLPSRSHRAIAPSIPEVISVKITSSQTGGGIYNGTTLIPKVDAVFDPESAYAVDDLFDSGPEDFFYCISLAELGSTRHEIPEGTPVFGRIIEFAADRVCVLILGAITNIRWDATSKQIQATFGTDPAESDWHERVQFTTCTGVTPGEFFSY